MSFHLPYVIFTCLRRAELSLAATGGNIIVLAPDVGVLATDAAKRGDPWPPLYSVLQTW